MRPYLAVIADSFSDAARSRVLWGLLAVWTLILAAVAPFGLIDDVEYRFDSESLINRERLIEGLQSAAFGQGDAAKRRVWERMGRLTRNRFEDAAREGTLDQVRSGLLCEGLNECLDDADLYIQDAWPTAAARDDLGALIENRDLAELSEADLARLNRRLVELAFPACFRTGDGRAVWIGYAGLKIGEPMPIARDKVRSFVEGAILPGVLQLSLGIIGVFVATVVTSHLVPDMFAAGSLPLLLSKPISRSGLLVAKFVGGVAFIFLNIAYLLTGLYLVLGWRLGIWNAGLFACIPIFVFVFMVYYAVSMLTGLIWRNAIVSIIAVGVFWGLCFTLGVVHEITREVAIEDEQFVDLVVADDRLVASSNQGEVRIYDAQAMMWQSVGGVDDRRRRVFGPCWVPQRELLVYGKPRWSPIFGMETERVNLQTLDLGSTPSIPTDDAAVAAETAAWDASRIDNLSDLPARSERIVEGGGRVLIAGESGVYEVDFDAQRGRSEPSRLFGIVPLPFAGSRPETYRRLTPPDQTFSPPLDAALHPDGSGFIVLAAGRLYLFKDSLESDRGDAESPAVAEFDLDLDEGTLGLVASNGRSAVVLTNAGRSFKVDVAARRLTRIESPQIAAITPKQILVEPERGRFAVVGDDRRVHLLDEDAGSVRPIGPADAVAAAWGKKAELLVVGELNRIVEIDLDNGSTDVVAAPSGGWLQRLYLSVIHPLYAINPKPAAVGQLIRKVLSRDDPLAFGRQTAELERLEPRSDIWLPLWSNSLFIGVCLIAGCLYLHRQDV